ncbi:P-type conjugative transfer protein TrbG [Nitrospirillum sp. BR 11752]|uniref:P-type conjugative transfer protein TrbG n=1 Tax=Nitrospirillum sp. BR 11752 TaxID=3104293 RepID=UPI002EC9AE50|nr:P-type conjugative transfer protein TrbG [Nitrospirillum sp. BR 11752]
MTRWLCLAFSLLLAACTHKPPAITYDVPQPAQLEPAPPKPVEIVTLPEPLPLPGQLKPLVLEGTSTPEAADPARRVRAANASAKVLPSRDGYINAMQVFPYSEGALYQVYVAPLHVTDIALEPGEELKSVAAGDTVQWKIGDSESGSGEGRQVHVLVKPLAATLPMNNLVILTDRRSYHLEAHPTAATYMAEVSWRYPADALVALKARNREEEGRAQAQAADGVDLSALRFRYELSGDRPPWRPVQVFDDGRKVYVRFPAGISQGEMPPLFVVGPDGATVELMNYRVRGATLIVDRLFAAAELRLGADPQQVVRITRIEGRG